MAAARKGGASWRHGAKCTKKQEVCSSEGCENQAYNGGLQCSKFDMTFFLFIN